MSAQPPPAVSVPDPKLDATNLASSLPQAQLENLRYKVTQIMDSIGNLIMTLNTPHGVGVAGGLAGWPDLMTKYNVLLSKTHSLAAGLAAPPTRKGQTTLRQIAPHPFSVDGSQAQAQGAAAAPPTGLDPQLDAMLDALLDGRRAPSVLKNDVTNVGRLRVSNADTSNGVNLEELRALEARLEEIRRAHDARCARGVEAVRQLKDKYDWKSRLLFDDSDTSPSGTVAGSDGASTQADEEAVGQEDEDMVEVAPEHEREVAMDTGLDTEDGTPTHTYFEPAAEDSDSSSGDEAEEGQVQMRPTDTFGVGINGDLVEGDGSDSDGMEDMSVPPFVAPLYQNGDSGMAGQPAQAPEGVSLENLWVIEP